MTNGLDEREVGLANNSKKDQVNNTLALNLSSQMHGDMSFELKGDIETLCKNIGNISTINKPKAIELQNASQTEIDDLVLKSMLEQPEKSKNLNELTCINPAPIDNYNKIQQKTPPSKGKIYKQRKSTHEVSNEVCKVREIEIANGSPLKKDNTPKSAWTTPKNFDQLNNSKEFAATSPLKEKALEVHGVVSRKSSYNKPTGCLENEINIQQDEECQHADINKGFILQKIPQENGHMACLNKANQYNRQAHEVPANCCEPEIARE